MKTKLLILMITAYANAYVINELPDMISYAPMFIYGTITTVDNEEFTGQIRWGKEEAFWFDHFNSEKPKNENLQYLDDDELDELKDQGWGNNDWNWSWGSCSSSFTHSFACHFGDIKSIEPRRGERLRLTFKNGEVYDLDGGSNDVGATVRIHDEEMGTIKLEWDRIDRVEFSSTPANLESAFGEPLYGSVKTYDRSFTGFLQWDHDERLSLDELNGDTRNGELDIAFGNIKSITKHRRGSLVVLKSGREIELTGSNDVNDENRGIIINLPEVGRVDINWDEFESIHFETPPQANAFSYDSYRPSSALEGVVTDLKGKAYEGRIVYDLDERYDLEILDGSEDELDFFIPFRNIKTIEPKNRARTRVKLRKGETMILGDKVDVTDENDGVLVFTSDDDYDYLPWTEIEIIEMK